MTEPARPYSTLRDGKIVWVYPGEALPAAKVRSRLETDSEVRTRLNAEIKRRRAADPFWLWFKQPGSGKDLDADLKELGLPARQMVDEVG